MLRVFLRRNFCCFAIMTAVCSAAMAQVCTTKLVSVPASGIAVPSRSSDHCRMTPDARYIAFASLSWELVAGDTNDVRDIFLRDMLTGVTEHISTSTSGVQANGHSGAPVLSDNGRYVAFSSSASNLVPMDTNNAWDVFVRDRLTAITVRVSTDSSGVEGNADSGGDHPGTIDISSDGQRIVFQSFASNLVPVDTNQNQDVYVHDLASGSTRRVTTTSTGQEASGGMPAISGNGRYVAFQSHSTAFVGPIGGTSSIFRKDLLTGQVDLVSVSPLINYKTVPCTDASITHDGRYIAFGSASSHLSVSDTNLYTDMFVRDMQSAFCELVSLGELGVQNPFGVIPGRISKNGRFVSFSCNAPGFAPGVTLGTPIYVRDRLLGTLRRVDRASTGVEGYAGSYWESPSVSEDGISVAFSSNSWRLAEPFSSFLPVATHVYLRVDPVPPPHSMLCSGPTLACPCSQDLYWAGCQNSAAVGGGTLLAIGNASVASDTVQLVASGLPVNAQALFFQGTQALSGGSGVPFGDGLLCVGGEVQRLVIRTAVVGSASAGYGIGSDPMISGAGSVPAGGATRHYQCWYRDGSGYCTPATYNLTSAITINWTP